MLKEVAELKFLHKFTKTWAANKMKLRKGERILEAADVLAVADSSNWSWMRVLCSGTSAAMKMRFALRYLRMSTKGHIFTILVLLIGWTRTKSRWNCRYRRQRSSSPKSMQANMTSKQSELYIETTLIITILT